MIEQLFAWLSEKFEKCEYEYDGELGVCFDINFNHVMVTICPDQWKQGFKFDRLHGWSVTASFLTIGTF